MKHLNLSPPPPSKYPPSPPQHHHDIMRAIDSRAQWCVLLLPVNLGRTGSIQTTPCRAPGNNRFVFVSCWAVGSQGLGSQHPWVQLQTRGLTFDGNMQMFDTRVSRARGRQRCPHPRRTRDRPPPAPPAPILPSQHLQHKFSIIGFSQ